MSNTILQVPVSKDLRDQAALMADEMGFSSLQEAVRLFMAKLASETVEITFRDSVRLSPRAVKRYERMIREMQQGKNTYVASGVKDLMSQLNGDTLPRKIS